jgi:hypothetical protein
VTEVSWRGHHGSAKPSRLSPQPEAVAKRRGPGTIAQELDAIPCTGALEAVAVALFKSGKFLEPRFGASGREHFDDAGRLVARVPHGVLDVARLEGPLAGPGGGDVVADEDADLAVQYEDPDVVAVHVRGDEGLRDEGLFDNGDNAIGVARAHPDLHLERTGERLARWRDDDEFLHA